MGCVCRVKVSEQVFSYSKILTSTSENGEIGKDLEGNGYDCIKVRSRNMPRRLRKTTKSNPYSHSLG